MLSEEFISQLHSGTCAIGYTSVPHAQFIADVRKPYFKVIGTGFLVDENIVMTNRHVIQGLLDAQNDLGFTDEQRIVMFVYPTEPGHWNITISIIIQMGHILHPDIDIGFISFVPSKDPKFSKVHPLLPQQKSQYIVSEEITICGYPYGHAMLQKNGKVYRWGPIIQQGYISAITPYENTKNPMELMLDIRIAPGMSGAPVIRQNTGQVIGIVHSSWESTTAVAFPLFENNLRKFIDQHKKNRETTKDNKAGVDKK